MKINIKISNIILIAMLVFSACSSKHDISYKNDVQPIFDENCISCHNEKAKAGDLILTSFENMKNSNVFGKSRELIVPNFPKESILYRSVIAENKTLRMPPAFYGFEELSSSKKETIKLWIEQGANNN